MSRFSHWVGGWTWGNGSADDDAITAIFVGLGRPMIATDDNRYTRFVVASSAGSDSAR